MIHQLRMPASPTSADALNSRRGVLPFFAFFIFGALLAFLRNPHSLLEPSMFTEDGVWVGKLYFGSLAENYLHTRPDYFVVGNILILHLVIAVNEIFFSHHLEVLPALIAVASHMVFGLGAAVGYLALRRYMPVAYVAVILLCAMLVPVGSARSASEIWGRVSNVGFEFSVVAAMLLLLRNSMIEAGAKTSKLLLLDGMLALACATNPIAIAFSFVHFGLRALKEGFLFLRRDILAAASIGAIAISVAVGVAGTQRSVGPESFGLHDFLVTAIARPLLFPFVFPIYGHLDDTTTILLGSVLVGWLAFALIVAGNRAAFGFFLICLGIQTLAVSLQRTELSGQLGGYVGTYPGRYFHTQGMLSIIAVLWASWEISNAKRSLRFLPTIVGGGLIFFYALNFQTIFQSRQVRCEDIPPDFTTQIDLAQAVDGRLVLDICPPGWRMDLPSRYRK